MVVAPLCEQTRIADQLGALLARVSACTERLCAIPLLLKRARQGILRYALSDDFIERIAEYGAEIAKTPLSAIAQIGTGSTPLRSNGGYYSPVGAPWITSAATAHDVVTNATEFVTPKAIAEHRLKLYPRGTLLVAMYGEGKTRGQVSELGIEATINQACAAVVVDEGKALRSYVKLALQANYLTMRDLAEGGNQPNLNLSKIRDFEIPLPPLPLQAKIVERAHGLLANIQALETRHSAAQSLGERLTPLLLEKAFKGELVQQDPSDEPASELLARIAAERDQVVAPTKARKPRAPRAPQEFHAMTKSRHDNDVMGQPYLARHLRRLGNPSSAEALFKVAELPVADFYKQLAWEMSQGHVKGQQELLGPADAA